MGTAFSSFSKLLNPCDSHRLSYLPQPLVPSVQSLLDAACALQLPGLVLLGYVLLGLLAVLVLLRELVGRAYKIWTAQVARPFVAVATTAAKELKTHLSSVYPPSAHAWSRDAARGSSDSAPVVCAVCLAPVVDVNSEGQHCQYCLVVCHKACARYMPADCKPLALPDAPFPVHYWRAAGVTLPALAAEAAAAAALEDGSLLGGTGMPHVLPEVDVTPGELPSLCLFCGEPCEVGLFASEPVWSCSWCHGMAHVLCAVEASPHLFSSATKAALQGQVLAAAGEGAAPGSTGGGELGPGGRVSAGQVSLSSAGQLGGTLTLPASPRSRSLAVAPHTLVPSGPGSSASHAAGAGGVVQGESGGQEDHPVSPDRPGKRKGNKGSKASSHKQQHHLSQNGSAAGKHHPDSSLPRPASGQGLADNNGGHHSEQQQDNASAGEGVSSQRADSITQQPALSPALHQCRLGPCARHMLPPTCIQQQATDSSAGTGGGGSGSTKSSSSTAGGKGRGGDGSGHSGEKKGSRLSSSGSAGGDASAPALGSSSKSTTGRRLTGGTVSAAVQWLQQQRTELERWQRYSLQPSRLATAGVRPLLVFVNLKSGPQTGKSMMGALLQLLHPLQVVELPRERPEAALRFFAPVRGLRVLVAGGDGTVGWVLQCIDKLATELAAQPTAGQQGSGGGSGQQAPLAPWAAPPVAILPVGTGNDLARCLGWGGNLSQYAGNSLASVLHEVAAAAPVRMDRWSVSVTPLPKTSSGHTSLASFKRLMRRSKSSQAVARLAAGPAPVTAAGGGSSGSGLSSPSALHHHPLSALHDGGGAPHVVSLPIQGPLPLLLPPSRQTSTKTLHNYLGIGIDAKVAWEFHHIRERYPGWFQSQLGNKVWYTGIGAPDLLRRSCADLHRKLRLVCDGVEVPLPPDAEGLVLTNINCHMGGVYLWETGHPAPPIDPPPGSSPSLRAAAQAVTQPRRQALSDGIIEVSAIGGVAHLGRMNFGLARAQRLAQASTVVIQTSAQFPMQVDGEPWIQEPAQLVVTLLKTQAVVLRRVAGSPANQRLAVARELVGEVLASSEASGLITAQQRGALNSALSSALEPLMHGQL